MSILVSTFKTVYGVVRWETTNLEIAYGTSLSVVEQLRPCISKYIVHNSRERKNSAVWIDKMEFQNATHLTIVLEREWERSHPRLMNVPLLLDLRNWQDWGRRCARPNAFMKWFREVLQELDLKYTAPIQPILLSKATPPLILGHYKRDPRRSEGSLPIPPLGRSSVQTLLVPLPKQGDR